MVSKQTKQEEPVLRKTEQLIPKDKLLEVLREMKLPVKGNKAPQMAKAYNEALRDIKTKLGLEGDRDKMIKQTKQVELPEWINKAIDSVSTPTLGNDDVPTENMVTHCDTQELKEVISEAIAQAQQEAVESERERIGKNHIWLNAISCINPTDKLKNSIGETVLNMLNEKSRLTNNGLNDILYLKVNKS